MDKFEKKTTTKEMKKIRPTKNTLYDYSINYIPGAYKVWVVSKIKL